MIQHIRQNKANNTAPILIIGKNGTLGRAFARVCEERYLSYKLIGRADCDISEKEQIRAAIKTYKPWALVNAAGYVRVDDAERDSIKCFKDNTQGAQNLAMCAREAGIQLMSFSTDLVFDGRKTEPYVETDRVNPLNVYGKSKAEAEASVFDEYAESVVIRTSAFFGPWDEYNFAHYVRKSLQEDEEIKVAKDLVISPTYVPDLVNNALDLLIDKEKGLWHLANQGAISWADFAFEIADRFDLDKNLIIPLSFTEMNYAAKRPINAVLGSKRGLLLPGLENALGRYFTEKKKEKRKVA